MTPNERERLCGPHQCDRPYWRDRAERAEVAARDFAQALDDIASFRPKSYPAFARNALARHPSFSGEKAIA